MSNIAQPDVAADGPRPSVMDGLSGGEFGEEQESTTLSMSALLAQAGQDEPDESEEAPDGTTDDDETDNSDAGDSGEDLTPEQKEIKELHSLLGRMSNELGELRKTVAEKDDDEVEPNFVPTLVTPEIQDEIATAVETQGGANVAAWAAVNRPDLYEAVLDVWSEQSGADARRAAEFNFRYQTALAEQEAEDTQASNAEFQKTLETELDARVKALAPDYGFDAGNEEHDKLLSATLSESPPAIIDLVVSRDPDQREAGLRAVFAMAVVKAGVTTPEADGAAQEAIRAAQAVSKGAATLGGGGLKPAAAPALSEEQAIEAAIAQRLLTRPSTSVSEGLTGGGFNR